MENSLTLYSSDDEESLDTTRQKDLRKKLLQLLHGVPPPSSITISKLSSDEILSKYKENEPVFGLSSAENYDPNNHRRNFGDFMLMFKNNSDVSEEIATLLQKVQERYVQLETMSSCNVWFQQSIPLTGSAKKRCRARQRVGLSPGRRLSHLARRKQIFSCANLQRMADVEKKKHLEIKKSGIYQDKVKATERRIQYEKLNTSKRALFMSPEEEFSNNSQVGKEFPKRKLFSSSEKKKKLPLKENSKRSEVKRWLFHQNFNGEVSRKRLRDENSDQLPERKKKCPRRSLTFTDEDESSKSPASTSTRSSHSLPPLSETHKNKLLWAVSVALKEANITRKDGNFKTCASSLFMTLRKNLNNILNSYNETTSTSEKMLFFARQSIPSLLEKLGLPPLEKNRSVLTPVKNQDNEHHQTKTNEGGKENLDMVETHQGDLNVLFKTPKKFIRVRKKSKTCDKVKGRSCFRGVLVRCKSLESLNTSGDEDRGSVAKKLFSQLDSSSNYGGDDTLNNCDDSCSFINQDTMEMTFLNDSDVNLASHSLAPSSVSDETDGSALLSALKKREVGNVNIVEETDSNDSEESNEIGNQDFKKEESFEGRIEESEDEELKGQVVVEESADEEEKERGEVMSTPVKVEESGDEEEKETRRDVIRGLVMVEESGDEEEKEVRSEERSEMSTMVEESADEEQEVVTVEERTELFKDPAIVRESGDEEEKELVEDTADEEEEYVAVKEEEMDVDISENGIKEEFQNIETKEETLDVMKENVEFEKGEVRDELFLKKEQYIGDEIKEEPSPCEVNESQNNSMLPPQTSTPILSPLLSKSKKSRKLMVKKTKRNWKIVRDQSQEDSVPLEDLKLKVRLSHEWEVIALNSSASELESSCTMNQSSMISLYDESNPQTDNLEESDSKLSNATDEEDLSAIRLKELLEEKNFVEIKPEPLFNEKAEEQEFESTEQIENTPLSEAQIETNEENVNNYLSPTSTVDHEVLQEIIRSENKYLKPEEQTPAKKETSPVLTNSDQKKKVLSLENYKARKQMETIIDLDGISPLKSDDGGSNNSIIEVSSKKIYNITLKHRDGHKRRHKHRREEKITPEKEEKHHRSKRLSAEREKLRETPKMNVSSSEKKERNHKSSSERDKSMETPKIDTISESKKDHESLNSSSETKVPKSSNITPEKVFEENIKGVLTMQALFKALFDLSNVLDQQLKQEKENPGSVSQEAVDKTIETASMINDAINKGLEEMKKEANSSEVTKPWLDLLSNFHDNNPLLNTAKISPKDPRIKNNEPSCSKDSTPKQSQNKELYRPYSFIDEETPEIVPQPPPVQLYKNVQIPNEQTPPKPISFVNPPPLVHNSLQAPHNNTTPRPAAFVAQPLIQNNVQIPNEYTPPKPIAFVQQPPPVIQNVQLPNEHTPPRQILHVPQNVSNNLYKQAVERNNQNWHERNTWTQPNSSHVHNTNRPYYQSEVPRKPLLEGAPGFSNYNYPQSISITPPQVSTSRTSDNNGYWIQNREELPHCSRSRLEGTRGFSNYNYPQNVPQHSQRHPVNYPHYSGTTSRGIPSHRMEEFSSPERNTSRYYNQSYHTPDNYMYNNHSVGPNGMYNSYSSWQSPKIVNNGWNGY